MKDEGTIERAIQQVVSTTPPPWDEAMVPLISCPVMLPIPKQPVEIRQFLELNTYTFQTALHWMIRLSWNSKHPIPGDRMMKTATQKTGEWLKHVRLLCQQCHDFQRLGNVQTPYRDSTDWFKRIVMELFVGSFSIISDYPYPGEAESGTSRKTKRHGINSMNAVCSRVNAFEYPCAKSNMFAFSQLLTAAISMAESLDVFKQEYFRPFIKAWRAMISEIDQHWHSHFLDAEQLWRQDGRGRHRKNLTSDYAKIIEALESPPGKLFKV